MSISYYRCFCYILLICLISFGKCDNDQNYKKLELDEKVEGKMDKDESREYFELKLPHDIEKGSLLVFTVKESRTGIKEGEEIFSDPDIYVSKTKRFPTNKEEATWYSERYGNDILTIPAYAVDRDEVFYICMYCQFKCRYQLSSYLSTEAPAELGKYYDITLSRKSSISYTLYVPSNPKDEELTVLANNPSLKNFRIFMAKEYPSSQNTFQIIPIWNGGYAISISKYNKDYCTDCYYHILFQTEEEEVKISFTAFFQSTLTKVSSGNVINDLIKSGSKRCYYFDTSIIANIYNSKLIFNLNLFSGGVILSLNGWKIENDNSIQSPRTSSYSYHVVNDKIILLKKEDFEYFDRLISSNDNNKNLYFCIFGQQMSSYRLSINFLSEVESLQRYNYISPGSELTGFLQGGQVTRYKLLDFTLNQNSIIAFSFTSLEGKVEFFSTFCQEKCEYNDEILKNRIQQGEIILSSEETEKKKSIVIKPEDNRCYKLTSIEKVNSCETLALVKCFGNSNDICSYKILAKLSDMPIIMSPKKTYYNIIPKGKEDLYEILVTEEEVNSIVIVLTSVTGDAELQIERKLDENEKQDPNFNKQIKSSRNKDYIPDVIRITPNLLRTKNVIGKYIVKVTSVSFSSYNLYYYTTRTRDKFEQPNLKDITVSLAEGNIIKDYFPNDIPYKIYSYTPTNKEKEDIKIIMTRINIHFSFKVYLDFDKIKYNFDTQSKYEEKLAGYNWASDHNNELTISKDDKSYSLDGPYYIIVTKDELYKEYDNDELNQDSLMSFYLGVTKKGLPFFLNEGVGQSQTISEKYNYQVYFYTHRDINNPLNLELNILNGEVDVFISTKKFTQENITQIYEILDKNLISNEDNKDLMVSTYMKFSIDNYASIELNKDYFDRNFKQNMMTEYDKSIYLYIYVIQSKLSMKYHRDSQYIINVKSSLNIGTILLSGQVYNMKAKENRVDYYIIEEIKHRKGMTINLRFKNGGGELYARIPKTPEKGKNITFPSKNNFDYIGTDTYMGKTLTIPAKVFDRINSNSLKLQILISVVPQYLDNANAEYSITYGSEPKRISQNVPYHSFIKAAEMHYFNFYFDETTENIFISLSNMNGDADMYLKYGIETLPTTTEFDWFSGFIDHEFIDININDPIIKKKGLKSLSGYYTLLILGFTETTYTLYISSHPDKIFPLYDNLPVSCQCQVKGEKCYFRYNNVYKGNYDNSINNNIDRNEIILTTQYIYGNGKMYASIYKDQELTDDNNKKYQQFFPDENNYQFSNAVTGKRNYLKVVVEKEKYSKDSLVLLTYICDEKTDVEITSASLQYSGLFTFIDPNRENMFYLKYNDSLPYYKQEESIINFFAGNDESLIYEIHAYVGNARITIYTNESVYNDKNEIIKYDYNHIAEFNLRAEKDKEFYFLKTYTEDYFNSINKKLIYNKNIYFRIRPLSDFGFYIQVTYDKSWINPPIGEPKSYLINKDIIYGYFDINHEFSNVEFSLSLEEFIQKQVSIYIKILVAEKDPKKISSNNEQQKLYHYEIPSEGNCDYNGKTDDIIGAININLNNLPIVKDNEKNTKFVRALFCLEVTKKQIKKRPKQAFIGNNALSNRQKETDTLTKNEENISPQTKVTITVTPGINNFKRIDLPQHTYYFSNTSLINNVVNNQIKQYDGNKEVKIYSLDKKSNADRKMIIQMHVCSGKYDFKLSKEIVDYDNNKNDIEVTKASDEYGRSKYLIQNLRDKHIYLSVKSAQNPNECFNGKDKNGEECSNELSYLIYYYSLTDNEYTTTKQDLNLRGILVDDNDNQIRVSMYPLSGMDRYNNIREQENIEYNLFFTGNENLRVKLDNICYLSQLLSLSDENTFNDTVNNITIVRNIKLNRYNEFLIDNLDKFNIKNLIFLNILARNLKTNELIAYIPMYIITKKPLWGYQKLVISFLIIFLLFAISYATFIYFKNKANEGYQDLRFQNKAIEMGSVQSKIGGYQRINL